MEGYPDGFVDIKRPSDDEENGFFANRSQGYCGLSQPSHAMTIPLRPCYCSPRRTDIAHSSTTRPSSQSRLFLKQSHLAIPNRPVLVQLGRHDPTTEPGG